MVRGRKAATKPPAAENAVLFLLSAFPIFAFLLNACSIHAMNFTRILPTLIQRFDQESIHYALIGGLAMALRGVQRATLDADFILLAEDLNACHSILENLGYRLAFHTQNVSHYLGRESALGRIDLLHAFRPATLTMLQRCERLPLTSDCFIPVVHLEDLIGLKVQAASNDPSRIYRDWNDIHQIVQHAGSCNNALDWELLSDYLALFEQSHQLSNLQQIYVASQPT